MTIGEVLDKLSEQFINTINTKNSWGKNEVALAYKNAELAVLRSLSRDGATQ